MLLTQLLSPEALTRMSSDNFLRLNLALEAEIVTSPEVRKVLQKRVNELTPYLEGKNVPKGTGK
jgi:spore coat protein CotF